MEDEDKPVKTENMGEESHVQQKNHGFSIESSGTLNEEQEDELSCNAGMKDANVKADLPPKINSTKGEG